MNKIKRAGQDRTGPRYSRGERLLQTHRRAQSEAETGRGQSGHDQADLGHVGKVSEGRGERGKQV